MVLKSIYQNGLQLYWKYASKYSIKTLGIYTGSSRQAHQHWNIPYPEVGEADLELFIIIDTEQSDPSEFTIKNNRYGAHVDVIKFPKYAKYKGQLYKFAFFPFKPFEDYDYLLKTNLQLSAATNIYYSEVIYSKDNIMHELKHYIMEHFHFEFIFFVQRWYIYCSNVSLSQSTSKN